MGLFRDALLKAQGLPTESEVRQAFDNIRLRIAAMYVLADSIDEVASYDEGDLTLGMAVRMDLLNFALHIASSDGVLENEEVAAINTFLGYDFSHQDCKRAIEEIGMGSDIFNREIPISFSLLTHLADDGSSRARELADGLVDTYIGLGSAISLVDGDVDYREKQNLDQYINMLKRYASTF